MRLILFVIPPPSLLTIWVVYMGGGLRHQRKDLIEIQASVQTALVFVILYRFEANT